MGISSAMNAGVMGLNVNSSKLSTISDNIANSETKGYKRSTMEFSSLVLNERPTSYDAGGVRASNMRMVDEQGALLSTRNVMDLAISGRGFLPVTDIAAVQRGEDDLQLKLLRTGAFRPDEKGVLRTNSGYALMGFPAVDGAFDVEYARESAVDLKPVSLADVGLSAEPTKEITLNLNLDARATIAPLAAPFTLPISYFDVLGGEEKLSFDFTPTALNTWQVTATDTAGASPVVAQFNMVFEASGPNAGFISSITPTALPTAGTWDAATGLYTTSPFADTATRTFNLGIPGDATPITQFKANNALNNVIKDGSPVSEMIGLDINERGVVDVIYASGFRKSIFMVPVVNVQNPNGLTALDGQAFALSRKSGAPYMFDAGTGPTGRLVSSALEESTTDIAEELTQLIKTQRAYSSNAKIIQTVDEMLQETTNLKR